VSHFLAAGAKSDSRNQRGKNDSTLHSQSPLESPVMGSTLNADPAPSPAHLAPRSLTHTTPKRANVSMAIAPIGSPRCRRMTTSARPQCGYGSRLILGTCGRCSDQGRRDFCGCFVRPEMRK
jgi:hypothetical protein